MPQVATTKLSSKGQVVIPEEIRNQLGLKEGVQFVVLGKGDVVILKAITPPSMKQFDNLITKARKQARKVRLKKSDVKSPIKSVRKT